MRAKRFALLTRSGRKEAISSIENILIKLIVQPAILKNFFKYHFPFILWALIIFIQSSFPAVELPKVEIISFDKILHMGVYGLLAGLCYLSLIHLNNENIITRNVFLWSAIITILYGASDEFHQYFVPNRSSEVQDWLADVAGILIIVLIIKYFLSKRYKLFQRKS